MILIWIWIEYIFFYAWLSLPYVGEQTKHESMQKMGSFMAHESKQHRGKKFFSEATQFRCTQLTWS